jgi:exodeoxyribonuclease V gamma subunit
VALHLTVAGSLEPLAAELAARLAEPLADPFAPEVVVVPGDGVRRWLSARLARHLGASSPEGADGIVANVDFAFPASLVRRALGDGAGLGAWSVGPLTWAVHDALLETDGHFRQRPDAVRARAIADLFDRYALHRPDMVLRWGEGADVDAVGAPLAEHHRWQPALWREVRRRAGGTTDVERQAALVAELAAHGTVTGTPVADLLPERVVVFGLASLPASQLDVLCALSAHLEVHVLAPVVSPAGWQALQARVAELSALPRPLPRSADPTAGGEGNTLTAGWGRTSREAHVLLLRSAGAAGAHLPVAPEVAPLGAEPTLLERLQHGIATDRPPPGAPSAADDPDGRPFLDPTDRSVRWHRCHGPARQVEVLRDEVLHLLEETGLDGAPRFEPRDIAVLCPDVATFAPLVEAVFAGDPTHGVPEIPVRVADRTLRQDSALLDATGALLDLLDGRFRASAVLAFVARSPVRRRFGLDASDLDRIAGWVEATNIRWGLDAAHHRAFGLPDDLGAHTWRAGLDQVLLGAAMAPMGARLGPGAVVPLDDVEGRDVEVAGRLAELVDRLDRTADELARPQAVGEWCERLAAGVRTLCDLPDDEAWQWVVLDGVLAEMAGDATVDGVARTTTVASADLVVLLQARLAAGGARARYGTGAVTVSALAPQRGVPHPVVCLLGIDPDTGASSLPAADDLVADTPCVGDRDGRSEQRAQLLDAVMAARERLVVLSTGRDVRTNATTSPTVALAELFDLVDGTVRPPAPPPTPTSPSAATIVSRSTDGREARASTLLTVDHPRQAWSAPNFVPGVLVGAGSWSFDRVAADAASARSRGPRDERGLFLDQPLPALDLGPLVAAESLRAACRNPSRVFLAERLGVVLAERAEARDDGIPLDLAPLDLWRVSTDLLQHRRRLVGPWDESAIDAWEVVERRRGAVPPGVFGDDDLARAHQRVEALLGVVAGFFGPDLPEPEPVAVDVAVPVGAVDVRVVGQVPDVVGATVVRVSASSMKDHDLLVAWLDLALLGAQHPDVDWSCLLVARKGDGAVHHHLRLASAGAAREVLAILVDLHRRVLCDAVPALAATTHAYHREGVHAARRAFDANFGDAADRWIAHLFGTDFDVLHGLVPRGDERGDGWAEVDSRLACWAERIWGTFDRTTVLDGTSVAGSPT